MRVMAALKKLSFRQEILPQMLPTQGRAPQGAETILVNALR